MFYKKDPRRVQPIFDYLLESFTTMDYNAELSFDVVKILSLFRTCYEELGWKFSAWMDEVLQRCWKEIYSEHEDVRTYIAEILCFADKIKVSISSAFLISRLILYAVHSSAHNTHNRSICQRMPDASSRL